jgi:hypothetical protein
MGESLLQMGILRQFISQAPESVTGSLISLSVCLLLALSGCNDESVKSSPVANPPRIDGDLAEWQNVPVRVFEEKNIAVGALQDARYLYVAGRSADEQINRMIARRGITIWIDPDGGDRKDLEMHYPSSGYAMPDPTRGGFWQAMSDSQRERAFKRLEGMRNGVLVIDKRGVDSRIFSPDSGEGFSAATAEARGILTFEVRIPLRLEEYFPKVGSIAGREKLRVGFSLGAAQGSGFREGRPEYAGPAGYPAGGMGGGSRGMLQRRRSVDSESDLWVTVTLTKAP